MHRSLIGVVAAALLLGSATTAHAQAPRSTEVRCDFQGNCAVIAQAPGGPGGPVNAPAPAAVGGTGTSNTASSGNTGSGPLAGRVAGRPS